MEDNANDYFMSGFLKTVVLPVYQAFKYIDQSWPIMYDRQWQVDIHHSLQ